MRRIRAAKRAQRDLDLAIEASGETPPAEAQQRALAQFTILHLGIVRLKSTGPGPYSFEAIKEAMDEAAEELRVTS